MEPDASRQPGTMMVHLQDAMLAGGAVMRPVWLLCLTFLAESDFACRFRLERRCIGELWFVGREGRVAGGTTLIDW